MNTPLEWEARRAMAAEEGMVGVFLDIDKAYDSIWKEGLMIKLYDAGVRGRMLNWIRGFLRDRKIQVRVGGVCSGVLEIVNGTPQGSVISPVLFNVMINDIFKGLGVGYGMSLFADDGAFWSRGRNLQYVMKKMQKGLDKVEEWAKKWGFKVSASKSKFMVFGNKRKVPEVGLTLYGAPLERVKMFKFLGMWLDERMTWKRHIEKVVGRCDRVINILRNLAGVDWGADRETLLMIYRGMVRAIIDYGCTVYGSAADTNLQALDVVQAKALRVCLGAVRTTPIPALLVEAGEWPLRLRRKKLGMRYWAKLRGSRLPMPVGRVMYDCWELAGGRAKGSVLTGLGEMVERVGVDRDRVISTFWSSLPPWVLPEPAVDLTLLYRKQLEEVTGPVVEEYVKEEWGEYVQVYTDGSRDPDTGKAGCGIYCKRPRVQVSLRVSDGVSVYATELAAIVWALWWVEQVKPSSVLICSDSAAALQALMGEKVGARADLVNEILVSLHRIGREESRVGFLWVPGHSAVGGNEEADSLAKRSLQREGIDVRVMQGKPEFCGCIKVGLVREWQEEWRDEIRGRHYYEIHGSVRAEGGYVGKGRREQVIMARLRLGHCCLARDLALIGKHDSGLCECGDREDVRHILMECRKYRRERVGLFDRVIRLGQPVVSLRVLLGCGEKQREIR